MDEDIFKGYGVQVTLSNEDDFLKVKETLTRMGLASPRDRKLFQSCHILHKQGKYAIVHFKELFALDRKPSSITEEDIGRRNQITKLLAEWGLVKVVDPTQIETTIPLSMIKIIQHKDRDNWQLVAKYTIGVNKTEK